MFNKLVQDVRWGIPTGDGCYNTQENEKLQYLNLVSQNLETIRTCTHRHLNLTPNALPAKRWISITNQSTEREFHASTSCPIFTIELG